MTRADHITLSRLTARVGERTVLEDVSLQIRSGELLGLVGSSGSGKTLTCRALLGMVDLSPGVVAGELQIEVEGVCHRPYERALGAKIRARDRAFAAVRGGIVSLLPQDAPAALDPFRRVGAQVSALCADGSSAIPWLIGAGFSPEDAARVERAWPHQLSGGMAQRVVVAQSLARRSRFLLADEPTTALDPPLQRRILATLRALCGEGMGVLVVTHDLGSLLGVADRIAIMDGGKLVEESTAAALLRGEVRSPAGQQLLEAARRIGAGGGS